jgi:WS/DGAT/MGAT family acyltransferase
MTRLSALDSSFLRVETPTAHMHIGWSSTLELPPGLQRLDSAALVARIASRLHLVPRFRQRLVQTPLSLNEPMWRDDPDFDLARHVTVVDDPYRAWGRSRELTDAFLSEQLPRDRPLWALLVAPRVGRDRALVVGKIHHAMVDGIGAVELGMLLFDASPDAAAGVPVHWQPAPANGPVRRVVDALTDSAVDQFRAARQAASLGLSPARGLRMADTVRRAAMSLADDAVRPAPPSYLNVPIGPRRTLRTHAIATERLRSVGKSAGVTLNDTVLTVTAGMLRRLAREHDEPARDIRIMVPVNVKRDGEAHDAGNRITFGFIDLPVAERRPLRQLALIHSTMDELKRSGRIAGSDALLRALGAMPEPVKRRAARLAASPRLYNLSVSNVPGPGFPLYAAGARVRAIHPVIPIPDHHALSVGVLTYDGRAHFSAYADPDALPRLSRLATMLEDAVEELSIATGASRPGAVGALPRGGRSAGGHGAVHRRAAARPGAESAVSKPLRPVRARRAR